MDNFMEDEPQASGGDIVTPAPPSSSLLTASGGGRKFVSAQRKYDNVYRVRDSETSKRLCYECGEVVVGGEDKYQDHILLHEGVYLSYQLYHFENASGRRQPGVGMGAVIGPPPPYPPPTPTTAVVEKRTPLIQTLPTSSSAPEPGPTTPRHNSITTLGNTPNH